MIHIGLNVFLKQWIYIEHWIEVQSNGQFPFRE